MNKILSIIIPSYNMEAYLPKCLASLIIDDIEFLQKLDVIVVNDGSKDCTSEIAHEYEKKYPGVFYVIDKPNGNYGSCINAGLKVARGTFVKILDADDYYNTECLKRLLLIMVQSEINDENIDLFLTDFIEVTLDGHEIRTHTYSIQSDKIIDISNLDRIPFLYMHSVAYRKDNLLKIKYMQTEGISYTDNEWVYYPIQTVRKLRYEHIIVYKYLIGRVGQTIAHESIKKATWILSKIATRMVENFHRFDFDGLNVIKRYLEEYTIMMCIKVYNGALLDLHNFDDDQKLITFETNLKTKSNYIYKAVINNLVSRKIGFYYGRYWCNHKSSNTFKFLLFRGYIWIVNNFINKFQKH